MTTRRAVAAPAALSAADAPPLRSNRRPKAPRTSRPQPQPLAVRRTGGWLLCWCLAVLGPAAQLTAGPPAPAGPKPLALEVAATSPPVRLGRPMPVQFDAIKLQPGLMEGRFEFRVHSGQLEFYRYTTDELVLSAPEQRLRYLFPPVTATAFLPELEIDVAWLSKEERLELPMQLLRVPFAAVLTPQLVVGEARRSGSRDAEIDRRIQALKLEGLVGPLATHQYWLAGVMREWLQTVVVSWDARAFPQDPLTYAAYDVVAVFGDVFPTLQRSQLEALRAWVRAGGSVYVEPDGVLTDAHQEFLSALTQADARAPAWPLDEFGKVVWPPLVEEDVLQVRCDLGRVVIVRPGAEFRASRHVLQFLWQQSPRAAEYAEALRSFPQPGFLRPPIPRGGAAVASAASTNSIEEQLSSSWRLTSQLTVGLLPRGVRLIPLWLLGLCLFGLLMAIGPVEWFVLGRLRARRFTWLTWPATTLATTGLLVGTSNAFLGTNDQPRALILHDLGASGEIVRTNRFAEIFPRQTRTAETPVQHALWSPLPPPTAKDISTNAVGSAGFSGGGNLPKGVILADDKSTSPPVFRGRVPASFAVEQSMRQWTPQVHRQLEIPTAAAPGPLDWSQIPWPETTSDAGNEFRDGRLVAAIRQQLGAEALVAVYRPIGVWTFSDGRHWWNERQDFSGLPITLDGLDRRLQPWALALTMLTGPTLTTPPRPVDSRSPHSPGLRDLWLGDLGAVEQMVLLVAIPQGEDWVVYRRLWVGSGASGNSGVRP